MVWQRRRKRAVTIVQQVAVFLPVRYADDFVILVSGTQEDALAEMSALATYLRRTTGLELSPEKTKITAMATGFDFLGFRFSLHWDKRRGFGSRVEIPKAKAADLRRKVKELTRGATLRSLADLLQELNPILRGWANYYRYCVGASRVFSNLDWYTWDRIRRWLHKKRPNSGARAIWAAYQPSARRPTRRLWRDGDAEQFSWRVDPRRPVPPRLDADALLCHIFWRAGCVTKGVCPVR
jgi:hypothetical protein